MTELIWDGKYKNGKKVAPVRIPLPFQTIETVNESAHDRQRTLDMFAQGKPTEWRNRLVWGDKKYVLPSLLPEFAGKVNLIYIDPPFNVGSDFSFTATIPDHPDSEEDETTEFLKEPSILEQKAYRDTWGKGLDSYLQWFYETVVLLNELLTENGSVYIHLDWHIGHYAKAVIDEVFGMNNFRNEIIWKRSTNTGSSKVLARGFSNDHDSIYLYSRSESYISNKQFVPHSEDYIKTKFTQKDAKGYYQLQPLKTVSEEKLKQLRKEGLVVEQEGKYLRYKQYLNDSKGKPVNDIWTDVFSVNSQANERMDYPTQKPEALLERIIKASSNENDLILDCFCGSGTTAATAEKLNRRWIACDLGRFAIHTTRKRLLQIPDLKPFVVQNLGKYERQAWQTAEFANPQDRATQEKAYRKFILDLYHAEPVKDFTWLHGVKSKRMVHVGAIDSPVSLGDVKAIIQELWKSVGKGTPLASPLEKRGENYLTNGVDVLGWEFAFDINETARQQAAASKVDMKFKKIPRDAMDKRAVEQGDVHFFELAGLEVKSKTKGNKVELTLKEFVIPPDDVPEEVRSSITHWSQWVDYWAVDWNYRDDTFHNEWQSYRTKKDPKIILETSHAYEEKGTYTVVVKVIDILGNDTTKALTVKIV